MTELISVIVPIYNTAAYLDRCIQSVLNQTYSNFEILLIDDGSSDGSIEKCELLRDMDARIRFFPQNHQGVSAARNAGICKAHGDYLFFLDSDDTIHPCLLEVLLRVCKSSGAALAMEIYHYVDAANPCDFPDAEKKEGDEWKYTYMTNDEALHAFFSSGNEDFFYGIGGKMIRRSAVKSLRFHETLRNGEDTVFIYELLHMGADAVILWKEWYAYWKYPTGNSSQSLTVCACKDTYQSLKYIWEQEQECPDRARFWAMHISTRLRRLYVRSRQSHSKDVSVCLWELAREEVCSARFRLLTSAEKFKYRMEFWCYPAYLLMHGISTWLWKRKMQKQERGGGKGGI